MIKNKTKIISILLISFLVIEVFAPAVIFASTTGTVNNAVNMRTGPSTDYKIITELAKGTKVTILDDSSHWYKISYNGKTGYASSNYIDINKEKVKTETKTTTTATSSQSSGSILTTILELIIDIIKGIVKTFSGIFANTNTNTNTSNITPKQQKVSDSAKKLNAAIDGASLCQAWVAKVYFNAGANIIYSTYLTARDAGQHWGVSKDFSKIQVGAAVYGDIGTMGHVGIYADDGYVYHNLKGTVKKDSLSSWISKYNGKCWGWNGGTDLTNGKYPVSSSNLMK